MARKKTRKAQRPKETGGLLSTPKVLRMIRDDIREMKMHSVDGTLILVPKADVLEIIQDWLEYVLNPDE